MLTLMWTVIGNNPFTTATNTSCTRRVVYNVGTLQQVLLLPQQSHGLMPEM